MDEVVIQGAQKHPGCISTPGPSHMHSLCLEVSSSSTLPLTLAASTSRSELCPNAPSSEAVPDPGSCCVHLSPQSPSASPAKMQTQKGRNFGFSLSFPKSLGQPRTWLVAQ